MNLLRLNNRLFGWGLLFFLGSSVFCFCNEAPVFRVGEIVLPLEKGNADTFISIIAPSEVKKVQVDLKLAPDSKIIIDRNIVKSCSCIESKFEDRIDTQLLKLVFSNFKNRSAETIVIPSKYKEGNLEKKMDFVISIKLYKGSENIFVPDIVYLNKGAFSIDIISLNASKISVRKTDLQNFQIKNLSISEVKSGNCYVYSVGGLVSNSEGSERFFKLPISINEKVRYVAVSPLENYFNILSN